MKKGFTIVEMLIVLICVGIIYALTIQGSGYILMAQVKREVSTVERMTEAVYSYYLEHDEMPQIASYPSADIDMKDFNHIIPPHKRRSSLSGVSWKLSYCSIGNPVFNTWNDSGPIELIYNGHNICSVTEGGLRVDVACHIENHLDDSDSLNGLTRAVSGGGGENVDMTPPCDLLSKSTLVVYGNKAF